MKQVFLVVLGLFWCSCIYAQSDTTKYDPAFDIREKHVAFPGGMEAFFAYVHKELKYPPQAKEKGIQGKVNLSFVVRKNGKVSRVKLLKGIGYGCDEEAIRIMKNSPDWKPAQHGKRTVRHRSQIFIDFRLEQDTTTKPLIVVDDKIMEDENEFKKITPADIVKIDRLTPEQAIEKYGEKGKNGAVLITTRKKFKE